jgi:hypothetical protein
MTNQTTALATVHTDSVIVSLMRASTALAEAKTIQQTKKIIDLAAAAEIYARRQQLDNDAMDMALSIKVEAIRKLGEILLASPKNVGVKMAGSTNGLGGTRVEPPSETPTLGDLGLTKKESAVAQKLAGLSEEAFSEVREGNVTMTKAIAAAEAAKRPPKSEKPAEPPAAEATTQTPEPKPGTDGTGATPELTEAEQNAKDAYDTGETDLQVINRLEKELAAANALLEVCEADDLKAEALKWRKLYDDAVREQSRAMDSAVRSEKREAWTMSQLRKCGREVGEEDPDKIAAAVRMFVKHAKVA